MLQRYKQFFKKDNRFQIQSFMEGLQLNNAFRKYVGEKYYYLNGKQCLKEKISYEFEDKGGMIVFSTVVNAVLDKSTFTKKIKAFFKGKTLSILNRLKHVSKLDKDEIKQIYDAENESFNVEGKAREKIIKELLLRGWIRIRRYLRPDMYTINVNRLNNKTKNYLYKWANLMVQKGVKYTPCKIDTMNGVLQYSVLDISQDVLYTESKKSKVKPVTSIKELKNKKIKKISIK